MAQVPLAQVPAGMRWDWHDLGACRDADSALFFRPTNARGRSRRERDAAAVRVCGGCQVRDECLDYAIRSREPYGVWGGLTEEQRQRVCATLPDIDDAREPGEGLAAARAVLSA